MSKCAAVDTDFIYHITSINDYADVFSLTVKLFKALDVSVVMHPLVHKNEKSPNKNLVLDRLVDENIITIPDLTEITTIHSTGKEMYENYVLQIYNDFTGEPYPCNDVFNGWIKLKSLGEVHTAAMCALLGYDYLFSDDKSVVRHMSNVVKSVTQKSIEVLSREICCERLKGSSLLTREERRIIGYKRRI